MSHEFMANLSVIPEDIQAKLKRLQVEVTDLQESLADVFLSSDDLEAIEQGEQDLKAGRARRL